MSQCNSTLDCFDPDNPRSLMCFEKAAFSDEVNFCACSTWFGWVGENCEEASGVMVYHRIVTVFLLLWGFVLILVNVRTIGLTFMIELCKIEVFINKLFLAGIFNTAALFCFIGLIITRSLPYFRFDWFRVVAEASLIAPDDELDYLNSDLNLIFTILGVAFGSLNFLFSSLVWEDLILKMAKYKSKGRASAERRCTRVVISLIGSTFFLLLGLTVLGELELAYGASLAQVIIIGSFHYVHSKRRKRLMKNLDLDKQDFIYAIHKVEQRTTTGFVISCTLLFFFFILYCVLVGGVDERLTPGTFNAVAFIRDVSNVSSMAMFTCLSWYINSISTGAIMSDFCPRICYLFRTWDTQNRNIYKETSTVHGHISTAAPSQSNMNTKNSEDVILSFL